MHKAQAWASSRRVAEMTRKKIRNIFIIIFYCFFLLFPIKVYDCFVEYDRLKTYYPKMKPAVFLIIYEYSRQNNLLVDQVCAVIQEESNWNQYAVSIAYARGYMQIMPCHHKGTPNDLFDPDLNIYYGCRYLKWCLDYAKGDIKQALKYYNAGPFVRYYANWIYVNTIIAHNKTTSKLISNYDKEIE